MGDEQLYDIGPAIDMLRREYAFGGDVTLKYAIASLDNDLMLMIARWGCQQRPSLNVLSSHKQMCYWYIVPEGDLP